MRKIIDQIINNEETNQKLESTNINIDGFTSNIDFLDDDFAQTNIKVFGVGGAGCNVISYMCHYRQWPNNIKLYAINTDYAQLKRIKDEPCNKFLLAKNELNGRGSGGMPQIGKNAVLLDESAIKNLLKNTDLLFIVAGLGKGTGSGGAPEIARIAQEMNICTVAIVNIPSIQAEGQEIYDNAISSLNNLINNVHTISTISNDRIITIEDDNFSMMSAFNKANSEVNRIIDTIINIINNPTYINIDFADVQNFLKSSKSFNLLPIRINIDKYSYETLIDEINKLIKFSYCNIPIKKIKNILLNVNIPEFTNKQLISDLKKALVQLSNNEKIWLVNGIQEVKNSKEIAIDMLVALNMENNEIIDNINGNIDFSYENKSNISSEIIIDPFNFPNADEENVNLYKQGMSKQGLKTTTYINVDAIDQKEESNNFHTTGKISIEELDKKDLN